MITKIKTDKNIVNHNDDKKSVFHKKPDRTVFYDY